MPAPVLPALALLSVVAVGLTMRYFSNRAKRRSNMVPATKADLVSIHERVASVLGVATARENVPAVRELAKRCVPFIHRAATALEFERPVRARLHINLVSMAMAWAEAVLDDPRIDAPRMRSTSRLGVAFSLLELNKFDTAIGQLEEVWLDEHAPVAAKRVAVMGRLYIHASLGHHDEAAAEEQLLIMLPHVVKMEGVDVTYTISRDDD